MPDNLTNLLPDERIDALRRGYYFRLGIVAALMLAALASIAAVLLIPVYLFLAKNVRAKEARLASIEAILSSADDTKLSTRVAALTGDTTALMALAAATPGSAVIRTALAVPRPGISLTGFSYAPASPTPSQGGPAVANKKGTLAITGVAATRDALRAYQLSIESAPQFLSADLPVSAYAKDVNSAFTITLTLAP